MSWKTLIDIEYKENHIKVVGSYDKDIVSDEMAVHLWSYINESEYDYCSVHKPIFANAKNKKWKARVEQRCEEMVLKAKDFIDNRIRRKEITSGLTDSLNEL